MILVATATGLEMEPLLSRLDAVSGLEPFCVGMGPVEAAARLARHLASLPALPAALLLVGVGGAYPDSGLGIGDLAVAATEVLADTGVRLRDRLEPFDESRLPLCTRFRLDPELGRQAAAILARAGRPCPAAAFATVAATSGTTAAGLAIRDQFRVAVENMEGAAVARVCQLFGVPLVELRAMSNLVQDRDQASWDLPAACLKAAEAGALVAAALAGHGDLPL
ncbi:MAG: futalosine hydrolase [Thermodesulfobacteriota bacterium]